MVSKLKVWKRIERGIEMMKRLSLPDAALVIVGDGERRSALEELAGGLVGSGRIVFAGARPFGEVADFYAAADIFLSLYDCSNLGNPLLEALYSGLPVVTLRDGSTEGLLEDGVNAVLVSPERPVEELAAAVTSLASDGARREALSAGARRTFREKVRTWEQRMAVESALLASLLRAKS
jgi:glycosyltransferase involved in cell wall biosynthesis